MSEGPFKRICPSCQGMGKRMIVTKDHCTYCDIDDKAAMRTCNKCNDTWEVLKYKVDPSAPNQPCGRCGGSGCVSL